MNSTPNEGVIEPVVKNVPANHETIPDNHIINYCEQMFDYAVTQGLTMPKQVQYNFRSVDQATLIENYNDLTKTISPANLQSIAFVKKYIFDEKIKRIQQASTYGRLEGWDCVPMIIKSNDDLRLLPLVCTPSYDSLATISQARERELKARAEKES